MEKCQWKKKKGVVIRLEERRSRRTGKRSKVEGTVEWSGGVEEGKETLEECRKGRRQWWGAPLLCREKVMRNKGPGVNTEPLILKVRCVMSEGKTAAEKEEAEMEKKTW